MSRTALNAPTTMDRNIPVADIVTPAQAADVIAVTTHDDFLLELGNNLSGRASIHPVGSVTTALDLIGTSRQLQILILDARDIPDLESAVVQLQTQAQNIPVVIFAEAHLQAAAAALKTSNLFAVLPMPFEPNMTAAVFEGAVADAAAKRQTSRRAPARTLEQAIEHVAVEPASAPESQPLSLSTRLRSERAPLIAAGAVAVVVLIAAAAWYFIQGAAPNATAPIPTSAAVAVTSSPEMEASVSVESAVVQGQLDELLEKARLAMRERRYAEPAGDNALLYFRSAAAANPANGEAADGLSRLAALFRQRFDDAMVSPPYEGATLALAQLKTATPADTSIRALETQLMTAQVTRAIADGNIERATALVRNAQQAGTMPPDVLTKWGAEIARLQDVAARKKLADEQAAREVIAAEQQRKAREAQIAAAETERQAQLARERERQEALKAEDAKAAALPAQVEAKAPGSSNSAPPISLKRIRFVAPEYPASEATRRIGGVVTVSFIINTEGGTRDVRVESADPAGVFDRAAVSAVQRWRYEPVIANDKPIEVPARALLRFTPPK